MFYVFHWLKKVGSRGHQLYRKEVALANIPVETNPADTGLGQVPSTTRTQALKEALNFTTLCQGQ